MEGECCKLIVIVMRMPSSRIGVYCDSQEEITWSALSYKYGFRVTKTLPFNVHLVLGASMGDVIIKKTNMYLIKLIKSKITNKGRQAKGI